MVPDTGLIPNPMQCENLAWSADSAQLTYEYVERGFSKFRVIEMDVVAGSQRVLLAEESDTFVDYLQKMYRRTVLNGAQILWMSERTGWNHLYRYDARTGKLINPVTQGNWVVRSIEDVDEEAETILMTVSGRNPGEDPYHRHWLRIGFDGKSLVALTSADGEHQLQFSPDGKYYIDRWSRVDHPPVFELRRAVDGSLVKILERVDITALQATGWQAPRRFVAKDRNGKFDIHGILILPIPFDPNKSYPVIENIYAGPQDAFVPKAFFVWRPGFHELAMQGFAVVKIDGLGTNHRGKEFHNFCYKNIKDAGLPDRIGWMRALAAQVPALDIQRVGIFGGSAGGQNALGALLFHPEFYKAAVADCGCHDNRVDKLWWNEQWMGWPIGPHYADNSNVTHADKLQGHLLLTVGELDDNVDPASTLQVADALIKADKEFELCVMPGENHGVGERSAYLRCKRAAFFERTLGGPQERPQ